MRRRNTPIQLGFTLVELLVAIGIIAVLIAILLPALARARQSAATLACASNLRQLHYSFMNYAEDNKQFWPAPWDNSTNPQPNGNWIWQWPYVVGHWVVPHHALIRPNQPDGYHFVTPAVAPQMFCPTLLASGTTWNYKVGFPMSGYSLCEIARDPKNNLYKVYDYPKVPLIHVPSEKAHVCDLTGTASSPSIWNLSTDARLDPHAGKSNYLFCDGHVETKARKELTTRMYQADAR